MANGIYIAVSGAQAEMRHLDVIANNLANANTPGFKADRINFREVLAKSSVPDEQQDRRFVEVSGTHTDLNSGTLRLTGNPLDLAVLGDGFFKVGTPRGERITRGGSFIQAADGTVMTSSGNPLLGRDGQPVKIAPNGVPPVIDANGSVAQGSRIVAQLDFVEINDPTALRKEEMGLFATDPGNLKRAELSQIQQGSIEESNGNPIRSMISLVETQRHFDTLHRAIETYKELDSKVTRIVS